MHRHLIKLFYFFVFALLFAMAAVFYLERTTGESAYTIFCIINMENFCPLQARFIFLISQWVPLLAVHAGFDLNSMLIINSVSHVLYFFFIFLFGEFYLKDRYAGLAILMIQVVGMQHNFFLYPHIEMMLIGGLMILLYTLMRGNSPRRFAKWMVMIFIIFLSIISYPSAIISILFVFALHYLVSGRHEYILYTIALLSLILQFTTQSLYEQAKMAAFNEIGLNTFLEIDYWRLIQLPLLDKPVLTAFLIVSIIGLIIIRKKLLAGALILFVFGYILLFRIIMGESVDAHYYSIIPMISLAFVYGLFQHLNVRYKKIMFFFIAIALLFSVYEIYQTRAPFTYKISLIKRLVDNADKLDGDRFIINDANIPFDRNMFDINLHRESILISALEGPDHAVMIDSRDQIINHVKQVIDFFSRDSLIRYFPVSTDSLKDRDVLMYADVVFQEEYKDTNIHMWHDYDINRNYFIIEGSYQLYNKKRKYTANEVKENIRIMPASELKDQKYNPFGMIGIPVKIINKGALPLYSHVENDLYLAYQWKDKSGELIQGSIDTPIEVDILDAYEQYIYLPASEAMNYESVVIGVKLNSKFIEVGYLLKDFNLKEYLK